MFYHFWEMDSQMSNLLIIKNIYIYLVETHRTLTPTPMNRETWIFQDNGYSHRFCRFRVSKNGVYHCNITTLGKQHADLTYISYRVILLMVE